MKTLLELLSDYQQGELEGKMFKYITSQNQIGTIHIDELEKEAIFRNIYPSSQTANGFRGVKTTTDASSKS
jgi:hypothetical protein